VCTSLFSVDTDESDDIITSQEMHAVTVLLI